MSIETTTTPPEEIDITILRVLDESAPEPLTLRELKDGVHTVLHEQGFVTGEDVNEAVVGVTENYIRWGYAERLAGRAAIKLTGSGRDLVDSIFRKAQETE